MESQPLMLLLGPRVFLGRIPVIFQKQLGLSKEFLNWGVKVCNLTSDSLQKKILNYIKCRSDYSHMYDISCNIERHAWDFLCQYFYVKIKIQQIFQLIILYYFLCTCTTLLEHHSVDITESEQVMGHNSASNSHIVRQVSLFRVVFFRPPVKHTYVFCT